MHGMPESGDKGDEFSMGEGPEERRGDDGRCEWGGGWSLSEKMGDERLMG
jgi:hypothetical protein